MSEPEQESLCTLRSRLDDLEKRYRAVKVAGVALLLLLGTAFLLGQASEARKTLEADLIVVKDRNGSKRFELDGAGAQFILYDEQGVARARLDLSAGEPRLQLNDSSGTRRILLGRGDDWEGKGKRGRFFESHQARFPSLEIVDQGLHPNIVLGAYQSSSRVDPAETQVPSVPPAPGSVVPITTFGRVSTGLVLFDWDGDRTVTMQGHQYAGLSIEDKRTNGSAIFGMNPPPGPGFAPQPGPPSLSLS